MMSLENTENCLFDDTERIKILINKIKEIRKQYGFPLWLIKEALEYYDEDGDKAIEKLIEISSAIGDHPDVAVKRNIENLMNEVCYSKNLMCENNSTRSDDYVNGYGTVTDTLRFLKRLSVIESQQTDVDDN